MKNLTKVLSAMILLTAISSVHAQQQMGGPGGGQDNGGPGGGQDNGGPGGGGPGGGFGGPPDPQQMQAMTDKRIKSALAVSDDTWSTLQPLIDKVEQLEHETDTGPLLHGRPQRPGDDDNGGPGGGPGGGGPDANGNGNGGPDEGPPQSAVESAVSDLKKVLADKSSSEDKIEEAMKTAQDTEKKAKDDLESARKDLRAAVSMRQQAVLVALGVLN